jgi:hypothetical protein
MTTMMRTISIQEILKNFGQIRWRLQKMIKPTAQQSERLTGGILRHFRAFSTPEQNPALEVLSTPAHSQVTQTVGQFLANKNSRNVFGQVRLARSINQ